MSGNYISPSPDENGNYTSPSPDGNGDYSPPSPDGNGNYSSPPPLSSEFYSPSLSTTSTSTSTSTAVIAASIVSVAIVAILICCLCCWWRRRRRNRKKKTQGLDAASPAHAIQEQPILSAPPLISRSTECTESVGRNKPSPPPPHGYDATSKCWFTYEELEVATDGFSDSNKLGEGGFGYVYKGMLPGGQLVAVKQLKEGVVLGEKQFQAEVEIISRVHHRHLVSLVGYCILEHRRLLVYHFLANDTLHHHLHGKRTGPALDWPTRLRIACGAARGLAYLHEDCRPRIIHRDIKSSNILLDDKFEAYVSDFGLARPTSDADTHVTTKVMGTFGYLAPEYAASGQLTEKSDVFSFGVVLLELLTGRKPVDQSQPRASLVEWARAIVGQINSSEYLDAIVDPALNGAYDPKQMLRMLEAAIACVSHFPSKRPRMGQVVTTLESQISLWDLNKDVRPHGEIKTNDFELEHGNIYKSNEMRAFNGLPIEVQEFEEWHANAQFKMNDQSFEMMNSNEYQQTTASRETSSTSAPTMSTSSLS